MCFLMLHLCHAVMFLYSKHNYNVTHMHENRGTFLHMHILLAPKYVGGGGGGEGNNPEKTKGVEKKTKNKN